VAAGYDILGSLQTVKLSEPSPPQPPKPKRADKVLHYTFVNNFNQLLNALPRIHLRSSERFSLIGMERDFPTDM